MQMDPWATTVKLSSGTKAALRAAINALDVETFASVLYRSILLLISSLFDSVCILSFLSTYIHLSHAAFENPRCSVSSYQSSPVLLLIDMSSTLERPPIDLPCGLSLPAESSA